MRTTHQTGPGHGLESTSPRVVRVIGYTRVSTADQAERGAGLAAQRLAITADATRRERDLRRVAVDAGASGSSLTRRPALSEALDALDRGEADVLMVAKLDRLSRSVADFASVLDRARANAWGLIALDLGVDTTTPAGELVANVMAAVAQWERRVIGQRTKEGLEVRRRAGQRLGRPSRLAPDTVSQIVGWREGGLTLAKIADLLNSRGVATSQGAAAWRASAVSAVLKGQQAALHGAGVEG